MKKNNNNRKNNSNVNKNNLQKKKQKESSQKKQGDIQSQTGSAYKEFLECFEKANEILKNNTFEKNTFTFLEENSAFEKALFKLYKCVAAGGKPKEKAIKLCI